MATNKWDDDFDPHKERKTENGLTHSEGIANVIKGCLGTGILALPEAFYQAGSINGIVFFVIISVFGTYCFHLNLHAQYILCKIKKVGFLGYSKSLESAFEVGPTCFKKISPCAAPFMDAVFIFYQVGALCIYIIFMGVNLKMICDCYFNEQPIYLIILYTFPPVLLLCLVPNIKWFTPFSVFANIVTFVTIAVIAWYVCQDLPDFNTLPYVGKWQNFPLFFGTSIFSLLSVPIILTVENNMNDPAYFVATFGALNIGFGLVTCLYALVGIMGYWRYGEEIKSSITLNFPDYDILAQVIRSLYVVAIWITYGLNSMVPRDVLWFAYVLPRLKEDISTIKKWTIDYTIRFFITVFVFIISISVPLLGLVISLTGGVCLSIMGIMCPALLDICALWPDNFGRFKWRLWRDIIIFFIGLFGLCSSMYAAVRDIIITLNN